ncbi:Protein of unknown function [Tenacibaculum sp. MAR_2009_124]|uniref:DUF2867 domain-containing protein n=1 Tax=Tenacibaculum sp. MAR_2009_124 TaxID=1250059 RepID=UPI00089BB476|nr:DUF2867 domain-containing protein [Tenacibaculum sp. MAR_2009_124]SEC84647.1 Protein of unknown function [Tenacibaculum sp. MAR_2009_124]
MKKVIEEKLLLKKHHQNLLNPIDFTDTFSTTNHQDSIKVIAQSIFNYTPKWIDVLFNIRNRIASFIGLKNEIPKDYNNEFRTGGYVGFFKIYNCGDSECILGVNDSHLNFRVIITKETSNYYNIKVTTLVQYNNLKGKIYMSIIKPFHQIIVRRMVSNAFKQKIQR